jgi:hypothetical protein
VDGFVWHEVGPISEQASTERGSTGAAIRRFADIDETEDVDERWRLRANAANEATFDEVVRRQEEMRSAADERIGELVERTRSSMRWIKVLSLTTFVAGLAMLAMGMTLAWTGQETPHKLWSGLGLGGAGTAGVLGVLLYRPMDRINRASADLAQQETMLRAWSMGVDLELMAADTFERDTVRRAADRLRSSSRELSGAIERYVEEGVNGHDGDAVGGAGAPEQAS